MTKVSFVLIAFLIATSAQAGDPIQPGQYGGKAIRLEVTSEKLSVEFSCAFGQFSNPELDENGNFLVRGWISSALVRPNNPKVPATLYGHVEGDRIDLSFIEDNVAGKSSSYVVVLGEDDPFAMCR